MSDYFDQVEQELRRAVRRHAHLPWYLRLRRRRHFRAAVVVIACLVVAAPALAAAGVFQAGTPVGASVLAQPNAFEGVAVPGTVRLLSLRVPDPAGGPPWVLRELRTTRGLECVQLGRLVDGKIGVLGQDGAFGNDGRFHPLSDNAFEFAFNCAALDARGHAFTVDIAHAIPASGLGTDTNDGGCNEQQTPNSERTRPPASRIRHRAGPICPPGSLRDVYFGMLGPDARTVTYTTASGRQATAPTAGPDGAFVIVVAHVGDKTQGESGGPTLTDYSTNPIRGVSYTDRRSCKLPAPKALAEQQDKGRALFVAALRARFPALAKLESSPKAATPSERAAADKILRSATYRAWALAHRALLAAIPTCPTVGYVARRARAVANTEVASPISVRVQIAKSLCSNNLQTIEPCGAVVPAGLQRLPAKVAEQNAVVTLTWTSRVAVTNQDSHYEVYFGATNPGANDMCASTSSGPTETDFKAGQKVTYTTTMPLACHGVSHGTITFVQAARSTHVLTGKFSVAVP